MAILVTADLSLTDNPRDEYRWAFATQLRELADQYKANGIYILGDLTEEKDRHSAQLVNRVVEYLEMLSPVIVLQGNHDYLSEDSPFFEFVSRIKGISWVKRPTSIGKWMFLPHTRNHKKDWKGIDFKDYDLIFAHQTFTGARAESGFELQGIPLDYFPKDTRIVSGDIHKPQLVKDDDARAVHYVGAPYTVDFGDDYVPRVFLIQSSGSLKSISVKGPQKRLIEATAGRSLDSVQWGNLNRVNPGDILKIRIRLHPDSVEKWPELKQSIYAWGAKHKYVIHMIQPVVQQAGSRGHIERTSPKSDGQLLEQYAKSRGVSDRISKTGQWLMEKAPE